MGELTDILRRTRGGAAATAAEEALDGPLREAPGDPMGESQGARPTVGPAPHRATIPTERKGDWRSRAVLVDERGAPAAQFRHLAVRLSRRFGRGGLRTLAITSSLRSEGKTTVSSNLALALASVSGGEPVALIELDLRRPRVAAGLGVTPKVGIEEVLAGRRPLEEARLGTQLPSLDLYLVGRPHLRAHELLAGAEYARVIEALRSAYRMVVVDTPPVLLVPDSPLLIPNLDGCLVVTRRGVTRMNTLAEALELLPEEKILGVFVNESTMLVKSRKYYYYSEE